MLIFMKTIIKHVTKGCYMDLIADLQKVSKALKKYLRSKKKNLHGNPNLKKQSDEKIKIVKAKRKEYIDLFDQC